jgi:rhamnosyl/mannosyltransferase
MRSLAADLVVVHEPNPTAIVAHALARPRVPLVFFVHAEVVRPAWRYKTFYRPFLRRMLHRASRIIVTSPRMKDIAAELAPFREKVVPVPLAMDADQHAVTPEIASRMREIREESPAPLALFVGRLVPYKGVDVLLRSLPDTCARAVIVGDGPLRPMLEQQARDLGVAGRVRFAGNASSDELTALYNACDLFVLPSVTRQEAFGMVQLEAMSCRKPVISTRLPSGVPWVNQDGETGLIVPPGDASALGSAVRTLLTDPQLRRRMGAAGRHRVETEFSVERLTGQTTGLYQSILESRG